MKVLKEKEIKLKQVLKKIVKEIGHHSNIRHEVVSEFKSRNLSSLRALWVLSGKLDLNTLTSSYDDIRFLFLFAFSLKKAIQKTGVEIDGELYDLNDYFTVVETRVFKNYRREEEPENIFPLVFKNVQQINDKMWQTILPAQELERLDCQNLLIYNFKTQRNPRVTAMGEFINIDKKKVREIKERLLNNEQYPDPIILNILNNGESQVVYDLKQETLTVLEGSVINIVDGFHRKTANTLALEENPSMQFNWQVTFTFLTEKMAHDYMSQKDKQKPMKKEYIRQMDYTLPENLVVDAISNDKLSLLASVMKEDDAYIKLNRALTKRSIIAQAVKECYNKELQKQINIRPIANWIVEFTDYLMSLYSKEFVEKPYEVKENSMINHKNMFFGYIALSKVMYKQQDNWKQQVKEIMEQIDFSKSNKLWREFGLHTNKDANKSMRRKLYSLFGLEVE